MTQTVSSTGYLSPHDAMSCLVASRDDTDTWTLDHAGMPLALPWITMNQPTVHLTGLHVKGTPGKLEITLPYSVDLEFACEILAEGSHEMGNLVTQAAYAVIQWPETRLWRFGAQS